jgi:hypothetical protein
MSGRYLGLIFVPVLLALAGINLPAEDLGKPPTMQVAPFTGDQATIQFWQADMGLGLSKMLLESLEDSDLKFQVVETPVTPVTSGQPKAVVASVATPATKEKDPGKNAGADSKKTTQADSGSPGKTDATNGVSAAISDFTFNADVIAFDTTTNAGKIGGFFPSKWIPNIGAGMVTAHIAIAWNIVDTSSQKIVKRGKIEASSSGPIFDFSGLTSTAAPNSVSGSAVASTAVTVVTNKTAGKSGSFFGNFGKMLGSSLTAAKSETNVAAAKPTPKAAPAAGAEKGASDSETYGYANPAFIKSALGKASAQAISNIITQLAGFQLPEPAAIKLLHQTPGKVIAAPNNSTIIISLGSNQGFKEGDRLKLYEISYVSDSDGKIVFTNEVVVGEIILSQVQAGISRCSYAGESKVKEGWVVKE